MVHHRFFVTRSRPGDLRVIKSALYNAARVAGTEENIPTGHSKGYTVAIVSVTGTSEDHVEYLANYQAARLQSFSGIGVSDVFKTYVEAESYCGEEYDAYPEMVHTRTPSQVAAESLAREFGTDVSEWTV